MGTVTATKLRNNLFSYLDKARHGESITVLLKKQEAARLIPAARLDWRAGMTEHVVIVCPPDELIKPMDDIWEDYL